MPELRGGLTRAFARLAVPGWRNPERPEVALRLGMLALTVAIVVNGTLFGLKLGVGLSLGSLALIADALDTIGDVFLDIVGLVGFAVSLRGADPEHPHGHQRAEQIASLTVATLLAVAAAQFGFEAGRQAIAGDAGGAFSWLGVAVALSSVVGKGAISLFTLNLARYTRSPLLHVSAWHYLTDVFSGLLAAAAILGRRYGMLWIDATVGVAIAVLLIIVAGRIFLRSANDLLGRGAEPEVLKQIHLVACSTPGVLGCQNIEVHFYGRKRRLNLQIDVADSMTLRESHDIADAVARALHGLHADWEPTVHVHPVPPDTPKQRHMERPL